MSTPMARDRTLMRSVVSSAGRTKSDRHIVKQMDVYTYCPMSWLDHNTALSSATFIARYFSVMVAEQGLSCDRGFA